MMIDWICDDMEFDHNSDVNTPQLLEILTHEKTRYLQKALLLNRFEDSKVDRVISDLELQIALCKKNEEHFKNEGMTTSAINSASMAVAYDYCLTLLKPTK